MFFSDKNLTSIVTLVFLFISATPACKQSEFSAGSGGGAKTGVSTKDTNPKKTLNAEPLGKEQEPDGDDDLSNDKDNKDNPLDETIKNSNDNALNKSLIDILGAILTRPTEKIIQENENEVITAPGKAFRIGDGDASGTSCAEQVIPVGVVGKIYYFEFEVTKESTEVSISFGVTCGIDYSDTNFIILKKGATEIHKKTMTKDVSNQGIPTQVLDIGKYTILVESRNGTKDQGGNPLDFDDFLVGELKVKANKPIKAGLIGSQ